MMDGSFLFLIFFLMPQKSLAAFCAFPKTHNNFSLSISGSHFSVARTTGVTGAAGTYEDMSEAGLVFIEGDLKYMNTYVLLGKIVAVAFFFWLRFATSLNYYDS